MRAPARRSMIEIEDEIGRARGELDLTLDALAVELAPKHLVEKAGNMVAKSLSAGSALGRAVRADPVPLALIGLGAAWLVAENTGLLRSTAPGRSERPAIEKAAGDAGRTGSGNGSVHQTADGPPGAIRSIGNGGAPGRTSEHSEKATHSGGLACRAGQRLTDGIERNPLLFGLAGIVCGAVIATLLPSSRREQEAVARAREDLWEKAEELGHRTADGIRVMARTSSGAAEAG